MNSTKDSDIITSNDLELNNEYNPIITFFNKYSVNNLLSLNNFKALLLLVFNNYFQFVYSNITVKDFYTITEVLDFIYSMYTIDLKKQNASDINFKIPLKISIRDIKHELKKNINNENLLFIIKKVYGNVNDNDIVDASLLNTFWNILDK